MLLPSRLRAWVIALAVGTDHAAFQQPNRSNDPVTRVATSSSSSSGNNANARVR
ncbi:MAG TPA: hypothetical protein VII33_09145 [Nakamurella sp.]